MTGPREAVADLGWRPGHSSHPAGSHRRPPLVLVTVERLNRLAIAGVQHAEVARGGDVVGLHIVQVVTVGGHGRTRIELEDEWASHPATRSTPLLTETTMGSVESAIGRVAIEFTQRGRPVIVVVPQLVHSRRWNRLLHDQTGRRIERALASAPGVVALVVPVSTAMPRDR